MSDISGHSYRFTFKTHKYSSVRSFPNSLHLNRRHADTKINMNRLTLHASSNMSRYSLPRMLVPINTPRPTDPCTILYAGQTPRLDLHITCHTWKTTRLEFYSLCISGRNALRSDFRQAGNASFSRCAALK
jgi:hypothetical protein